MAGLPPSFRASRASPLPRACMRSLTKSEEKERLLAGAVRFGDDDDVD